MALRQFCSAPQQLGLPHFGDGGAAPPPHTSGVAISRAYSSNSRLPSGSRSSRCARSTSCGGGVRAAGAGARQRWAACGGGARWRRGPWRPQTAALAAPPCSAEAAPPPWRAIGATRATAGSRGRSDRRVYGQKGSWTIRVGCPLRHGCARPPLSAARVRRGDAVRAREAERDTARGARRAARRPRPGCRRPFPAQTIHCWACVTAQGARVQRGVEREGNVHDGGEDRWRASADDGREGQRR
jgi:hypothetical protein